jgi:arabinan endo-1,5-alpha-L-arabinosidase
MNLILLYEKFLISMLQKSFYRTLAFIFFIITSAITPLYSLQNHVGAHDPSSIIKCGDTYWIFTTGNGIYSMYSTDLIEWTAGATPFTISDWPSWITAYVPDFEGHFWAPECVYINGKYYLYYSCSFWGVRKSVIGLATNLTLDPASPDYEWIDEGMVVYSNEGTDVNCIDPSLFWDDEGKLWLSYGSYFGGIRLAELSTSTGKPLNTTRYSVAGGDCEASYVINRDKYYYLFINRGTCCQGINSTYHIQVGRSQNPTGPFLDKEGVDLVSGGGTTLLSTSDNFIGPGCLGYYKENEVEWATYHYYDGNVGGMATLGIGNMRWDEEEWPLITSEWIDSGIYSIASIDNYNVWSLQNCEGIENETLVQRPYIHDSCQQWMLTNLGNGFYKIQPMGNDFSVELNECRSSAGTSLVIGPYSEQSCEIWKIERTNGGSYSIASKYGNRVAAFDNEDIGSSVELANYSGDKLQKWIFSDTSINITSIRNKEKKPGFSIYPNPLVDDKIFVRIGDISLLNNDLIILSAEGCVIFRQTLNLYSEINILLALNPGLYWVYVEGSPGYQKLVVLK